MQVSETMPAMGAGDAVITEEMARAALPSRAFGSHKWGVGGLVVVAGAPGYVGAAVLTAMAAGRAGAGIMNLAVPRAAVSAISTLVPEAAYIPIPDQDPTAARKARDLIVEKMEKSAALVIGPGLGEDDYASALLGELFGLARAKRGGGLGFSAPKAIGGAPTPSTSILNSEKPAVVDADALNWLSKQGDDWWRTLPPISMVMTPHLGEMSRLLGVEAEKITADPVTTAKETAARWRQVVVLKYGHTVITDGEVAFVAPDAPQSLATAGSGDVFAGTIGGFLAQGVAPLDAAMLAVFLGCRAARRVERRTGVLGLIASDLPLAIAEESAALAG